MRSSSMAAVAAEARVATSTVSRYLSGDLRVGDETELRIRSAIDRVGYRRPNSRSSTRRDHRLVAIIVADLGNAYYAAFADAAARSIEAAGYAPVTLSISPTAVSPLAGIEALMASGLSGAVSIGSAHPEGLRALLKRQSIPLVTVEEEPDEMVDSHSVDLDNYSGARQVVTYLTRIGHRDIAFISGPRELAPVAARRRGYVDGLRAEGILPEDQFDLQGDCSEDFGFAALTQLLAFDGPRPTAVFVAADEIAVGVLNAAAQLKVRIPEELSVVGFDDIPAASHVVPRLTTVHTPLARLADTAAAELIELIPKAGSGVIATPTSVPVSLVVRDSTAAI